MHEHEPYNEAELLRRMSDGDQRAFRVLYEQYWNRVYSIALNYLSSPMLAQDAVQEIFLRLWVKRKDLPAIENLAAYLNRMARNLVIDGMRRKLQESAAMAGSVSAEEPVSMNYLVESKEIGHYIHLAIAQLTNQQRQVYELAKQRGLPLKQVADELGISYNTARAHMSQALKSIRHFLKENLGHLYLLALLFIDF